ncbi:MAG TPA: dihydrolipoamide acetyltransferase family protein [Actinomycetota bacterium]|nr:dihydrolipoamide acetyltransferase family protein [Actinomycetota bacterium]
MTTIKMPQLGETIVEGTILKWLKQEGESIERDESLFEISTDKVDTEVPSPVNGTVSKILVEEGQTVPVGTDLAEIAEEGAEEAGGSDAGAAPAGGPAPAAEEASSGTSAGTEPPSEAAPASSTPAAPSAAPAEAESASAVAEGSAAEMPAVEPATPQGAEATAASATSPEPAPADTGSGAMPDRGPRSKILSPLVRRLADEHGLDLSRIQGSGTGGRITKQDVMAAIDSGDAAAAVAAPATEPAPAEVPAPAPSQAPQAPTVAPVAPTVGGPGDEVAPISHIRKLIGQHMVGSLQTSARAWTMVEVNIDHLVKLRERVKEGFKAKHGVNLTYLPFVIRATCDALLTHPEVNSELRGDEIVRHRYVNMGIAVSYDAGLIVPVIKGADAMNTVGLARAIADLAGRARAHQLKPDEIQGSTFTITNPGPYGSIASLPIINQPNTGILSIDAIQKRAVVIDDTIAIRSMVNISMSWDHRTIDGEIATRFLARVKQNLESWDFAEDVAV